MPNVPLRLPQAQRGCKSLCGAYCLLVSCKTQFHTFSPLQVCRSYCCHRFQADIAFDGEELARRALDRCGRVRLFKVRRADESELGGLSRASVGSLLAEAVWGLADLRLRQDRH
jgi:hypothetical protein